LSRLNLRELFKEIKGVSVIKKSIALTFGPIFMKNIIITIIVLYMSYSSADVLIDSDLKLLHENLSELVDRLELTQADRKRLAQVDLLMFDISEKIGLLENGNIRDFLLRLKVIKDYRLRIEHAMGSVHDTQLEYVKGGVGRSRVASQDDKQFLYDKVPCDLGISLDEWQLKSLSSRRMNTIRCYLENSKSSIYEEYLGYVVTEPNLKGQIKYQFYIKPNGKIDVFNKETNLPDILVNKITNKLINVEFPKMSDEDFEVQYTFSFYPK
jgi:hypothetical protein